MSRILLLGAGFSRNWGGWLTSEITTNLGTRLEGDSHLTGLLQRNANFEEALADAKTEYSRSRGAEALVRLQRFQGALAASFADMNKTLAQIRFEFQEDHGPVDRRFSVREFLAGFDAIFTVNQDLFLETRYFYPAENLSLAANKKWLGGQLPGMVEFSDPSRVGPFDRLAVRRRPQPPPFTMDPRLQPYFKMHGSTNWTDETGEQLLVIGGNKPAATQTHRVFAWYGEKFDEYLSAPGARLMVIGYGFGDAHINGVVYRGWQQSQLSMLIIHPLGRDILRLINPTTDQPPYRPGPLEEITSFDSTQPLSKTFGGEDPAEHQKLLRFLETGSA
jgi:hypothetical protein